MIAHVLGWLTLVSEVGLGGATGWYLWRTGSRPYTWNRPLVVPEPAGELHLSSGADYVGWV